MVRHILVGAMLVASAIPSFSATGDPHHRARKPGAPQENRPVASQSDSMPAPATETPRPAVKEAEEKSQKNELRCENASVSFTFELPGSQPERFALTVCDNRLAHYESEAPKSNSLSYPSAATPMGPYAVDFAVSEKTRAQLFALARAANYFDGSFNYTGRPVANMGAKTLAYRDIQRNFKTDFNYSENRSIQQLSNLFRNISNTQESARRLQFLRRFDRIGLEAELKSMEALAREGQLAELGSITETLESVANDTYVMKIARQRARRLLEKAKQESFQGDGASPPAAEPQPPPS